jgi:hypothetical protein
MKTQIQLTPERVTISRMMVGICHMQVCCVKDATDAEILHVCNSQNPSGTRGGWSEVIREGIGAPVPCMDDSTRIHVMIAC